MAELASKEVLDAIASSTYEGLIIRPGDHLIIRISEAVDLETANEVKSVLQARIPELSGVTVIVCDQLAVFRNG